MKTYCCVGNKKFKKAKKQYLKERTELFGLLALPQSQLSLAERERERYLKEKLRMI
jgi:hypothetical protein